MDEMPEFLDYLKGKAGKCWGTRGKPIEVTDSENKETATVMMAADLAGFIYGVQFLFKRKTLTEGMTACMDVLPAAKCFDSQIYSLEQRSTYCLVSPTEKGMQTGKTFLEFLQMLRTQVDHRNRIAVRPPARTPHALLSRDLPVAPLPPYQLPLHRHNSNFLQIPSYRLPMANRSLNFPSSSRWTITRRAMMLPCCMLPCCVRVLLVPPTWVSACFSKTQARQASCRCGIK